MADIDVTQEIHAAPIDVWRVVRQFSRAGEWHPGLRAFESTGDAVGALNTLGLPQGGAIVERLASVDEGGWTLTFELTESPFPIEFCNVTVSVSAAGRDRCVVGKRARFEPNAGVPAEGLSGAFREAFERQLASLKSLCEAGEA